jgi:hypothetical protein
MPIFLLSHSSFLVLTFLTCTCWFLLGFSLCFSLWGNRQTHIGDMEGAKKIQTEFPPLGFRHSIP